MWDFNFGINWFCSNFVLGVCLCVGVFLNGGNLFMMMMIIIIMFILGIIIFLLIFFVFKVKCSDVFEVEYCVEGEVFVVVWLVVWEVELVNWVNYVCFCIMWRDVLVYLI